MNLSNKIFWSGMGILFLIVPLLGTAPRIPEYANDIGPTTIDISHYPPDMQKRYPLFAAKCSGCHTIARAINSEFVTDKEWSRYVKRMAIRPPCCNFCPIISMADAKVIWQFLVYDSQVRKTGKQAAVWAAQRQKLLDEYKEKYPDLYAQRYGASKCCHPGGS